MFEVILDFYDKEQERVYKKGEIYKETSPERSKALSTKQNLSGKILIKKKTKRKAVKEDFKKR